MIKLNVAELLVGGGTCLLAIGWLYQAYLWLRHLSELEDLTLLALPPASTCGNSEPEVTVVVPACNEQNSIATTLQSLLASEGIGLQIYAVNDRSTDQTGIIMDSVAAAYFASMTSQVDPKYNLINVLHISELPHGWLGKPHALATAAKLAKSDWILFTDGDVTFAPTAVARAVAYAKAKHIDHLVLMPDWIMKTPGEAAMHGALHALSAWTFHPWRVPDPLAKDFLGVGAFNLVRRSAYESIGGFTALRMEILEDLRFGWTLKRAGFRQTIALGPGLAGVRWSVGAWGVVRNLEKNLFALYRYRIVTTLFASFGLAVQILLPLVALVMGFREGGVAGRLTFASGVSVYGGVMAVFFASRRVTRVPLIYVIFYPLAISLFLFAHLRSMLLALLRGGILWRGTLYSLKDLRANAGRFW